MLLLDCYFLLTPLSPCGCVKKNKKKNKRTALQWAAREKNLYPCFSKVHRVLSSNKNHPRHSYQPLSLPFHSLRLAPLFICLLPYLSRYMTHQTPRWSCNLASLSHSKHSLPLSLRVPPPTPRHLFYLSVVFRGPGWPPLLRIIMSIHPRTLVIKIQRAGRWMKTGPARCLFNVVVMWLRS